jgi:hypothetical protein
LSFSKETGPSFGLNYEFQKIQKQQQTKEKRNRKHIESKKDTNKQKVDMEEGGGAQKEPEITEEPVVEEPKEFHSLKPDATYVPIPHAEKHRQGCANIYLSLLLFVNCKQTVC